MADVAVKGKAVALRKDKADKANAARSNTRKQRKILLSRIDVLLPERLRGGPTVTRAGRRAVAANGRSEQHILAGAVQRVREIKEGRGSAECTGAWPVHRLSGMSPAPASAPASAPAAFDEESLQSALLSSQSLAVFLLEMPDWLLIQASPCAERILGPIPFGDCRKQTLTRGLIHWGDIPVLERMWKRIQQREHGWAPPTTIRMLQFTWKDLRDSVEDSTCTGAPGVDILAEEIDQTGTQCAEMLSTDVSESSPQRSRGLALPTTGVEDLPFFEDRMPEEEWGGHWPDYAVEQHCCSAADMPTCSPRSNVEELWSPCPLDFSVLESDDTCLPLVDELGSVPRKKSDTRDRGVVAKGAHGNHFCMCRFVSLQVEMIPLR